MPSCCHYSSLHAQNQHCPHNSRSQPNQQAFATHLSYTVIQLVYRQDIVCAIVLCFYSYLSLLYGFPYKNYHQAASKPRSITGISPQCFALPSPLRAADRFPLKLWLDRRIIIPLLWSWQFNWLFAKQFAYCNSLQWNNSSSWRNNEHGSYNRERTWWFLYAIVKEL